MASSSPAIVFSLVIMLALTMTGFSNGQLSPTFYYKTCPKALSVIQKIVFDAVRKERRMGASLLRLHFHDCFVNGCDGSILLDDIPGNFTGEKTAFPNVNSVRGFEVIDRIKSAVDRACGRRPVVSCADILAVAARDSVNALGGPRWNVQLGRRDSTTASLNDANSNLPPPFFNLTQLITSFQNQGLNVRDLVALSGAHTIGFSQCQNFRNRIYNDTNIDPKFARTARQTCPRTGGNTNLRGLDSTALKFDLNYFNNLLGKKGLLHSDQELFVNGSGITDSQVRAYSRNPNLFAADFAKSMIKMGNMKPLTGRRGQIRVNCRKVN